MSASPTRRVVNVFAPTIARADAVSDQARHQVRLLRRWGHDARLVGEAWDASSAASVVPLGRALASVGDAAWVVHYSIWSEGLARVVGSSGGPKAFVYHNVTPPELLPRGPVAEACLRARRALPELAGGWDLVLTYSDYSAGELRRAGFGDPTVVPLLLPLPLPLPLPQSRIAAGARDQSVLFVGRIAPSKGLAELIKAFALLRRLHRPESTLEVVGSSEGWERHVAGLQRLIDRIGCGGVTFHGVVCDADRDAHYARCGVMCVMSHHEGYCAPIVEAMRAGAPVVAVDAGAVCETLGGGGLLLPDHDPRLAAEALAEALGSEELRARLRAGSGEAVARADPVAVEARLRTVLCGLLAAA